MSTLAFTLSLIHFTAAQEDQEAEEQTEEGMVSDVAGLLENWRVYVPIPIRF